MQQTKKRIGSLQALLWLGFVLYLMLLIKLIIFKYPIADTLLGQNGWSCEGVLQHLKKGNFIPFHTICLYLRHWNWLGYISFVNLIYNIIGFIPYGAMVPILQRNRRSYFFTMITGILFSFLMEITQLIGLLGEFDIDDIILNSIGVLLGILIHNLFQKRVYID